MQLSKHFKLAEFTKSQIAARNGLKNLPGAGEVKNLENVCYEILEPVRAKFDEKPVLITSGFRSLEVNRILGSSDSSQHCKGQAVDLKLQEFLILRSLTGSSITSILTNAFLNTTNPTTISTAGSMCRTTKKELIVKRY